MRFTVVDASGAVSFVAPAYLLKALVAACSHRPSDLRALLALVDRYDAGSAERVLPALAVFDEHNTREHSAAFRARIEGRSGHELPPFRVVDEATRRLSLEPAGAGLVVFNLPARRIVQIQNSFGEVRRQDRGRMRREGEPTGAFYHYRLPEDWSLLP
jgi:hypothetical protein